MPALRSEIPAHLAPDRAQALDHHDDLLAEAIFLDRLDLHPAQRNVVDVDGVIDLADPDDALQLTSSRGGRGRKPWRGLRPASSSPRSIFWSNLKPDRALAGPHHGRRDLLRRQFDRDRVADLGAAGRPRPSARRPTCCGPGSAARRRRSISLATRSIGSDALVVAPLARARHRGLSEKVVEFERVVVLRRAQLSPACAGSVSRTFAIASNARKFAPNWDFRPIAVKKPFHSFDASA